MTLAVNTFEGSEAIVCGFGLATVIIHLALASGVYADARVLREFDRKACFFIGPFMWAFTTLFTGLLGASAYWLFHRSTLRRD